MFLHPRIVPLGIDLPLDKLTVNILAVSIPDRRGMPLDCVSLIGEIRTRGAAQILSIKFISSLHGT